jgi:hypothetical protein
MKRKPKKSTKDGPARKKAKQRPFTNVELQRMQRPFVNLKFEKGD